MAVTLTGTNGLFTRLGKLFQIAVQVKTFQGTLATEIQDALNEFDAGDNDHAIAITNIKESAQRSCASVYGAIRATAHKTLIEMVNDDDPLPAKTVEMAIDRLIRQMEDASASINSSAYSVPDSADGANTGNGTIIASSLPGSKTTANIRAESIVFKCITDVAWPGGSGFSGRIVTTDPAINASSQTNKNILTNSSFENFTTNTPDNWAIAVGSAGTQVTKNSTAAKVFQGTNNLKITGDGASTLTKLTQNLDTAGGTTGKLLPDQVYFITFKYYLDTGISAGAMKVSIKDSGGTVITANSLPAETTANLGAAAASQWNSSTAFFMTPKALSTNTPYTLNIELTTAITNTKNAYIDQVAVGKATQIANGPYVAIMRGATNFVRDDEFVMAVAKSSTGTMQENFDKFFDMYARGKQLPENSAGGETIADSLIA